MNAKPSVAIVTTTIYVPKLLDSYADDAKKYGHEPLFVVIGDKKTPTETAAYCADLAKRSGLIVEYFSPERQDEYLKKFPALKKHLPWNTIQRRNVGILYAYESGCDTIITIDDDNFRVTEDYIGANKMDSQEQCTIVSTSTGWINVCRLLSEKHGRVFHHRGFPLEMRHDHETWREKRGRVRRVVNAGLWLGDPDVDAMTRLYHNAKPIEALEHLRDEHIALAPDTWSPFNSQNTALHRDIIPAYFLSPKIGRYDDIWAAYIIKRIADELGDSITFGKPIVKQERNPHNYWRDLDAERYGHALTLRFVESLAETKLSGKNYAGCFKEILDSTPDIFYAKGKLSDEERTFMEGFFEGLRVWRETFATLS